MPPDLRLTGFALGVWLAALASLYLPAAAGGVVAGALAAASVAAVLVGRRRPVGPSTARPLWNVLAVVLLGGGLGAAVTAIRVAERDGAVLDTHNVYLYRVADGRIVEGHTIPVDQHLANAFWGPAPDAP